MARGCELGPVDARAALDLAIRVEQEAFVRYSELARLIGDDPAGAGEFCRAMAEKERDDRDRLAARRAALRDDDGGPPLDPPTVGLPGEGLAAGSPPATARAGLAEALAGERRAEAFYAELAGRAEDEAAHGLLDALRAEEADHAATLVRKLAELDASAPQAALPCAVAASTADDPRPTRPPADAARVEAALVRFDAATQAIARGLLIEGRSADAVAWELGVTRRTVLRKLRRFLEAVPSTPAETSP
jgi:rubrerythrin